MFFKSSSNDSYVIYSVTYINRSAICIGLHANIGRVCRAYNTSTYGQGTVKTAVRFSTAIKTQRTVSHWNLKPRERSKSIPHWKR